MGLGDELMASGQARVRHALTGKKVSIVDRHRLQRWSPLWDGNPKIARLGDQGRFEVIVNGPGARPYILEKWPERWVFNPDFRADVGELYLTAEERAFASYYRPQVVIEPNVKPKASPNKDWGWERWQEFARLAQGIDMVQLGPKGTRQLDGVALIETRDFRHACAVLANARAYVGHEGGLHHAAAALGIPGVVIFGGFIPVELTGYAMHRNLGAGIGSACGMRVPCEHCAAEMAKIDPEQVLKELRGML
jgi:ADP-heptose:LPS heptosyltransferase